MRRASVVWLALLGCANEAKDEGGSGTGSGTGAGVSLECLDAVPRLQGDGTTPSGIVDCHDGLSHRADAVVRPTRSVCAVSNPRAGRGV